MGGASGSEDPDPDNIEFPENDVNCDATGTCYDGQCKLLKYRTNIVFIFLETIVR